MRFHCCLLDRECRSIGFIPRLHIDTKNWHWIISLWRGGSAQAWYPWSGYTKKWRAVTVRPGSDRMCPADWNGSKCSRLKGHRGGHRSITWKKNIPA